MRSRYGLVAEMSSQLRQAAIDRFVRGWTASPNLVDKLVTANQLAVTARERHQDLKDQRLGAFLMIAMAQHTLARHDLPVAKNKA